MKDLNPEERALLGLASNDAVEPLGEARPEPSDVALARAAAPLSLQQVSAAIVEQPDFDPVLAQRLELAKFARWTGDPGIYRLPVNGELVTGTTTRLEDIELVDARSEPALVRLRDGDEHLVARLHGSRADCFRLDLALRHPPLPLVTAPDPVHVPAPNLAALLSGSAVEPWLDEASAALAASEHATSHVAAVGLLVRAWRPVDADARKREIDRFIAGEPGLVDRARAWLAALDEAVVVAVAENATEDAMHLPQQAETLRVAFAEDDAMAESVGVGFVLARDDLASVSVALELVGHAEELQRALRQADRASAAHVTALSACASAVVAHLGARIDATAQTDADAWWLRLFS